MFGGMVKAFIKMFANDTQNVKDKRDILKSSSFPVPTKLPLSHFDIWAYNHHCLVYNIRLNKDNNLRANFLYTRI